MSKLNNLRIYLAAILLVITGLACGFSFGTNNSAPAAPVAPPAVVTLQVAPAKPIIQASNLVQPTTISNPLLTTSEEAILVEMYKRINGSVVKIVTYAGDNGLVVTSGEGSGFLFDTDGHIVTNSHVVHGSDQIEVVFSDGLTENAQIVGQDLHSDLAVIKVENFPQEAQPLPLGNIDEVAVGQTAIALGNPFGLGGTLTRGIISAMGRTIPALTPFSIPQAIQTDAPINPGNSGGPLLNLAGEVIGVNAQIETGGESRSNSGIGFAIPVSIISRVVPALIQDGKYEWSWLGVVGGNINATVREAMNLPVERGAYISEVVQDGPADTAGLQGSNDEVTLDDRLIEVGGDVIIGIDGVTVNTFEDILIYIALNTHPGQSVELTIVRDGETQNITLTLEPRPTEIVEFNQP
jgi:2-alkenal reductase